MVLRLAGRAIRRRGALMEGEAKRMGGCEAEVGTGRVDDALLLIRWMLGTSGGGSVGILGSGYRVTTDSCQRRRLIRA